MNNPIGIIDSGVGGLSIASVLAKKLPQESIIYFADSANCPYGEKSQEQICKLSKRMVDYLMKKNIKLLVIACNTITVLAIDGLRKDFPGLPVVGIVPVIKTAAERTRNGRIGIFSTKATAKSQYQRDLINRFARDCEVISIGSSSLVSLIESCSFDRINKILAEELEVLKNVGIDTLVLGCSHFSLIKGNIQKILPNVLILDSAGAVTRQVKKILKANEILSEFNNSVYNFLTTGELGAIEYFINKEFGKNGYRPKRINLDGF